MLMLPIFILFTETKNTIFQGKSEKIIPSFKIFEAS